MPPVESSPRLDEEQKKELEGQNRMTFFNVVKNINSSPQKDELDKGDVFDLANIINKTK